MWEPGLVEAMSSLRWCLMRVPCTMHYAQYSPPVGANTNIDLCRYQGYVCPGMLVTLAGEQEVAAIGAAWADHTLLCPPHMTILRSPHQHGCQTPSSPCSPCLTASPQGGSVLGVLSDTAPPRPRPLPPFHHLPPPPPVQPAGGSCHPCQGQG